MDWGFTTRGLLIPPARDQLTLVRRTGYSVQARSTLKGGGCGCRYLPECSREGSSTGKARLRCNRRDGLASRQLLHGPYNPRPLSPSLQRHPRLQRKQPAGRPDRGRGAGRQYGDLQRIAMVCQGKVCQPSAQGALRHRQKGRCVLQHGQLMQRQPHHQFGLPACRVD